MVGRVAGARRGGDLALATTCPSDPPGAVLSLHPTHPTPYTLQPTPYTLHPTGYMVPYALFPLGPI